MGSNNYGWEAYLTFLGLGYGISAAVSALVTVPTAIVWCKYGGAAALIVITMIAVVVAATTREMRTTAALMVYASAHWMPTVYVACNYGAGWGVLAFLAASVAAFASVFAGLNTGLDKHVAKPLWPPQQPR